MAMEKCSIHSKIYPIQDTETMNNLNINLILEFMKMISKNLLSWQEILTLKFSQKQIKQLIT